MRTITVCLFLALLATTWGCGGGDATPTTAAPSTTTTTLAPTTTTSASAADAERARAQLESDLAALRASIEELGTLGLGSTQADFTAVRDNIERSWDAVRQSAAALGAARSSQVQGDVDAFQKAWDGIATLLDDVQSGKTTMIEAVAALPAKLAALASAMTGLSEAVKPG